jgi:hypothetical protein
VPLPDLCEIQAVTEDINNRSGQRDKILFAAAHPDEWLCRRLASVSHLALYPYVYRLASKEHRVSLHPLHRVDPGKTVPVSAGFVWEQFVTAMPRFGDFARWRIDVIHDPFLKTAADNPEDSAT